MLLTEATEKKTALLFVNQTSALAGRGQRDSIYTTSQVLHVLLRDFTVPFLSLARTIFIKGALFGTDRDDGGGASRDGCGATAHAMNSLRILSGREGERAESLSVERRKKERKTEG